MENETLFHGIKASAPIFRAAPESTLHLIVGLLSDASHHFADDSRKEWEEGGEKVALAAQIINKHKLGYYAIKALHSDLPQLVTFDHLIDAVLKDARK